MRGISLLLTLTVGLASSAQAARRLSIAELEQLLAAAQGQSDGKVARQLADLELTERASSVRLARWETQFPGNRCHGALTLLADASAFLNLPIGDLPANPPPDMEARKAILAMALRYVDTTTTRLPNFLATRKTEYFEDTPAHQTFEQSAMGTSGRGQRGGAMPGMSSAQAAYVPLHSVGKSTATVSYKDGFELRGSKRVDLGLMGPSQHELNTSGEFGPILSVVLGDALRGQIFWGHWEQAANGQPSGTVAAVFRYTVPKEQSNYMVGIPHGQLVREVHPAYHGEIAIDPSNGAILRITVTSDLAAPDEMLEFSIAVEYGLIPIGGTNYICPVRSLALSKTPYVADKDGAVQASAIIQTQLNDTAFVDYHLFRAEARVLTGENSSSEQPTAPPDKSNP